jgi:hypothetical protein
MSGNTHPAAPHHLPAFVTEPGQTDYLLLAMAILLLAAVLGVGVLFFRLHTLPERLAHKSQKLQFEIVAILGLLALFTHIHLFWVAGLLLAMIDIPDFSGIFGRMAHALERLAGIGPRRSGGEGAADLVPAVHAEDHRPLRKPEELPHA